MALNLHHLQVFSAVARTGSVTRAAEELTISQPAVSKQLRLLERAMETTLVDRLPKGTALTDAGKTLADYARRIFDLAQEAEDAVRDLRGLRAGRVAVGASRTIGTYILPEAFVQFRKRFPDVHATLEVASSDVVAARVAAGDSHVGYIEQPTQIKRIESREFRREQFVAIVSRTHRFARRRHEITAAEFCHEPLIVRETESESGSFVERILRKRGILFKPAIALGSSEAIKRAVAAGMGVAFVSRLSIELELRAKLLAIVPLSKFSVRRSLFRITAVGRTPSGAAAEFVRQFEG